MPRDISVALYLRYTQRYICISDTPRGISISQIHPEVYLYLRYTQRCTEHTHAELHGGQRRAARRGEREARAGGGSEPQAACLWKLNLPPAR
jgi:hypothetical protein